jgi:hypothetical protein
VLNLDHIPYILACHAQIDADPDPAYHFDEDPDANPDPDFYLMRTWILIFI